MEYKTPTEDMKGFVERAQEFWKYIDVDEMKPIVYGPEVSEEEMAERMKNLKIAEENMKLYNKCIKSLTKTD